MKSRMWLKKLNFYFVQQWEVRYEICFATPYESASIGWYVTQTLTSLDVRFLMSWQEFAA